MHHYQHNIKTFNHATRHLTRVERALYRDLIELYYDTEQPLPAVSFDKLCRLVLAHSDDEKTALKAVLDEFFVLTGEVYSHDYCDEQIEKYRTNSSIKSKAGKASAEARKVKSEQRKAQRKQTLNTCSTDVQLTSNQEPVTIIKDNAPAKAVAVIKPKKQDGRELLNTVPDLLPQVADDYMKARKNKKAGELTLTALSLIETQAKIAGLTVAQAITFSAAKNWAGFKASWYEKEINDGNQQKTYYELTQEAKERDADKRLTGLANADMATLEALGLAKDGKIKGARSGN